MENFVEKEYSLQIQAYKIQFNDFETPGEKKDSKGSKDDGRSAYEGELVSGKAIDNLIDNINRKNQMTFGNKVGEQLANQNVVAN